MNTNREKQIEIVAILPPIQNNNMDTGCCYTRYDNIPTI